MIKQVRTLLFTASTLIAITPSAFAQAPQTLWIKNLGASRVEEYANAMQPTSDGGFIIAGQTGLLLGVPGEVWLVRTDAAGDTLWTKKYGGAGREEGHAVQQTGDGGFIIAGTTTSYGAGRTDAWLIRTNAAGDTVWTKTYGGSSEDYAEAVELTADGGFIITGNTFYPGSVNSDLWLIRADATGDTLWTRTFGGPGIEQGKSVQQTSDGGFVVTGRLSSFSAIGQSDVWLIRTDADGDSLWTRSFAGPGPSWSFDYGNAVQQTIDGGFVVVGSTDNGSITVGSDVFLIRTDANGDTLWTRAYAGIGSDEGHAIQETAGGGFIIAGETYSPSTSDTDLLLIRTDAAGDTLWTKIVSDSRYEAGYAVRQISDGGFVIAGRTHSFGPGDADALLIRLAAETPSAVAHNPATGPAHYQLSQNYPNPFNPVTTISFTLPRTSDVKLTIYDLLGREVATLVSGIYAAGKHRVQWHAGNVANGLYLYRLETEDYSAAKRLLLVK
jgi:hypothetical protein